MSMRWRARLIVESFAKLPSVFSIQGNQAAATSLFCDSSGWTGFLVDFTLEIQNLEDAYYRAFDLANELLDAISFLSFAPTKGDVISVTVPKAKMGEPFDIALPINNLRRSTVTIDAAKLSKLCSGSSITKKAAISLRKFRSGLASTSPYQVISDLWSSVETIAEMRGRENKAEISNTCKSCEHNNPTGRFKTTPYIQQFFNEVKDEKLCDADAKKAEKATRELRNVLAHGGELHDMKLRQRAENAQAWLQSACARALVQELDIKPDGSRCQHLGISFNHLILEVNLNQQSGQLELRSRPAFIKMPASMASLPLSYCDDQPLNFEFGVFSNQLNIQQLALPELN